MEIKNNFISVVSLGSFNPSILTPDFLRQKCGFKSNLEPKGRTTPIATGIDYGSVSFLLDLERFIIRHSDVTDFLDTPIVKIMINYLTVLEYTPLGAAGININYAVTKVDAISALQGLKENDKKLFELLKLAQATTTHKERYKRNGTREFIEFDMSGQVDDRTIKRLNVAIKNGSLQINHNHEIRNPREDRERLEKMESDWKSLVENDQMLRKAMFGGPK